MSGSLTRKPRSIQKLAADGDLHPDFVALLAAVGFDVADVRFHPSPATVQSDKAVLIWARSEGRILVCHDRHRDRATRQDVYDEIYQRGGKVIEVGGDNSQSPYLALGKLLIHRQQWQEFFRRRRGGLCVVHKETCFTKTPAYLHAMVTTALPHMPTPKLKAPAFVPAKPKKKKPKPPRASALLPEAPLAGLTGSESAASSRRAEP